MEAMGATLWLVLTVVGFVLLRFIGDLNKPLLQAIAVRAAAFAFIGAGLVGASGWIGQAITTAVTTVSNAGSSAGSAALGTGAVWVVWVVLGLAWILTLLPETWFGRDIPDWLSVSGLVLPSLMQSVPGPVGDFIRSVFQVAGRIMTELVSRLFGM